MGEEGFSGLLGRESPNIWRNMLKSSKKEFPSEIFVPLQVFWVGEGRERGRERNANKGEHVQKKKEGGRRRRVTGSQGQRFIIGKKKKKKVPPPPAFGKQNVSPPPQYHVCVKGTYV